MVANVGRVHALPFSASSWLLPERGVRVWTPPAYDAEPTRRFPVIYAHDGRSWRLQDTLTELIAQGRIDAPIVVMIDSVPPDQLGDVGPELLPLVRRRWLEYNLDMPGPGQRYLAFLCDELKPQVDLRFRTRTAPEDTHALGSSMGGLCAFLSLWRRPDVFGNAACLSPVFQAPLIAEVALRGGARFASRGARPPRLYVDNGGDTARARVAALDGLNEGGFWWLDTQLQPGVDGMARALQLHEARLALRVHREPGGRHSERGFGARAALPLQHLLAPRAEIPNAAQAGKA